MSDRRPARPRRLAGQRERGDRAVCRLGVGRGQFAGAWSGGHRPATRRSRSGARAPSGRLLMCGPFLGNGTRTPNRSRLKSPSRPSSQVQHVPRGVLISSKSQITGVTGVPPLAQGLGHVLAATRTVLRGTGRVHRYSSRPACSALTARCGGTGWRRGFVRRASTRTTKPD